MMSDDDHIAEPLPLDAWHRARGARMVPFAGYAMPIQYEGIIAEHQWTREHAGLFDVSHMGQLTLSGEGLDEALEAVLPADVKSLALGRMRYSLLLNDQGGIVDDLMFSRWPDKIYMVVNGAVKAGDIAHLRARLPDAIAIDHLTERALLALQGPQAFDALARVTTGKWDLGVLTFMMGGQPEVKPIGLGARDSLRLEAGLPLYGHDLDTNIDPVSADLGFAISKRRRAEGRFPGDELILGHLEKGAPTKRVGFSVEGRLPAREGAEIFAGGERVGMVTSGGFAPTVGAPIAMGYVAAAYAAPGTALEIEVRGKRLAATVTPMPFVPHRYVRKGAA
jgi:aminomethyltransferase